MPVIAVKIIAFFILRKAVMVIFCFQVLNQTFPDHTFLMNGLVMGIKGILSFLSAPLIGALSDIWGRKFFLLITVFFTCAPIPLMTINTWWFFAMISISGIFAVTFSVVFAYVADVTTVEERSRAYGLVSATFAASLVCTHTYKHNLYTFIISYHIRLNFCRIKYTYIFTLILISIFFFLKGNFTCLGSCTYGKV